MLTWLLIILGFTISFFFVPPIGPIVYLVGLTILFIIIKILKTSTSHTLHATKNLKLPAWLPAVVGIPCFIGFNAYFINCSGDSATIGSVILSFFLSCAVIYLVGLIYKKHLKTMYNKFLYSAVKEHFDILSKKYKETVYAGDYGETIYDKWYKEVEHFVDGVIKRQEAKIVLSDEELKKRIIQIFDEINTQNLKQKQ